MRPTAVVFVNTVENTVAIGIDECNSRTPLLGVQMVEILRIMLFDSPVFPKHVSKITEFFEKPRDKVGLAVTRSMLTNPTPGSHLERIKEIAASRQITLVPLQSEELRREFEKARANHSTFFEKSMPFGNPDFPAAGKRLTNAIEDQRIFMFQKVHESKVDGVIIDDTQNGLVHMLNGTQRRPKRNR